MANPFTSFAFPASVTCPPTPPASCNHSMPDRLSWRKNVKDFGAKGDGVTDDWPAIMAAWAAQYPNAQTGAFGTVFFPPGTYYISQPLDVSNTSLQADWLGVGPASQITGNFPDFLLKRFSNSSASGGSPTHVIENLSFLNTNDTVSGGVCQGGGIKWGQNTTCAIRNCTVVANFGISTATSDQTDTQYGSFPASIENCYVTPHSQISGTRGIASTSCGPIRNCRILNYEVGMLLWNGEGAQVVSGCYFEGCKAGIHPGLTGNNSSTTSGSLWVISGCRFKNCGVALEFLNSSSSARIVGCTITGDQTVTVYGERPQYGIQFGASGSSQGADISIMGMTVTGQFDKYAIDLTNVAQFPTFMGITASNNSSHSPSGVWGLPSAIAPINEGLGMLGCNVAPVFVVAALPASPFEGETYNVSDSNTSVWAATAGGSGSTHAKVRYNGSNWTVEGI